VSDLSLPGDERAGTLMSDGALLRALLTVEDAWLATLVDAGIAPDNAVVDLTALITEEDLTSISLAADGPGNPVVPVVDLLRERCTCPEAAQWLHRGLTSQDVMDTAFALSARDVTDRLRAEVRQQADLLGALATEHRDSIATARTLTQPAVPTTLGLVVAGWLAGTLDAAGTLPGVPLQCGGAAGTRASLVELAGTEQDAERLVLGLATRLGLSTADPWHTRRTPVTGLADAVVACTDAWGRMANDVLLRCRPEIGEVSLQTVGGSSTMPHKQNPTAAVLVRRTALAAPALAAQVHVAAASQVDERADGGWHAEWPAARALLRQALVAASFASEIAEGLVLHADRARKNAEALSVDLLAEQRSLRGLAGRSTDDESPTLEDYLGTAAAQVDAVVSRAAAWTREGPE